MIEEESSCIKERPSLLKKYDISVNDLSYEYVKDCKDVKVLEKIIKILRSGEEGIYPDLLAFTENKLRDLSPGNRLIMKPEPVPLLSSLSVDDQNKISHDIASWTEAMKENENLLSDSKSKDSSRMPPIRSFSGNNNAKKNNNVRKKTPIKSLDYKSWESYDPDKEIMQMEVEEARELEEHKYLTNMKILESNIKEDIGQFSDTEKKLYSLQEKDRGNEFYNAQQLKEACHYYTRSIEIFPNIAAYNNRAMTYLKLKKYEVAILDCNEVLKRDADNVKALFRRGSAHERRGHYSEALRDFERVVEVEPSHKKARSLVSELKKKLDETNEGKPKKARMVIEDVKSCEEELKSIQIFDKKNQQSMCSKPSIPSWQERKSSDPMSSGDNNKLNEWGYSRVLCNCTSIPLALQRKPTPRLKDPGKSSVQVANKYCSQVNKESIRNDGMDIQSEKLSGSSDGSNSYSSVQPSPRDMPLLTDCCPSANTNVDGALLGNTENNSVDCDVEMQCSKDQPMEISKDDDVIKEFEMCSSNSPYSFLKLWNQITDDVNFSKHASLLKRIEPSNLSKVIGEKLDGDMLSTIMECLNLHFSDDENLLLEYLIGISQLPRFRTVILFLSTPEKNVVRGIFKKLECSGKHLIPEELKTLYEL